MIKRVIEMQRELNRQISPRWEKSGHKWGDAIWTECAELLDHIGWKWWKDHEPNMDQARLEVVDIWHFVMSWAIQEGVEEMLVEICDDSMERKAAVELEGVRGAVRSMALSALSGGMDTSSAFSDLVYEMGMTIDDVNYLYIGKHTLNRFRQDHGYGNGSYIKIWGGVEDNEVLTHIMTGGVSEPSAIYAELLEHYMDLTS